MQIKRLFIPIRKVNTLNFSRPIQIYPLLGWALNLGTTVVHYLKRIFFNAESLFHNYILLKCFFTYFQRLYENKCVCCVKGCPKTYYDCTIACDSHDK